MGERTKFWDIARGGGLGLSAVMGALATVSPQEATSHLAAWLAWAGIDRVPPALATAAADEWVRRAALVLVTAILVHWVHVIVARRRQRPSVDLNQLAIRLQWLSQYLRGRAARFGLTNEQSAVTEIYPVRMTLESNGFRFPEHLMRHPDTAEMYVKLANYFEWLAPLIRDGHAEEARKVAAWVTDDRIGEVK